jgi:hypothetical protein
LVTAPSGADDTSLAYSATASFRNSLAITPKLLSQLEDVGK